MHYAVADPNSYLVLTGLNIDGISIRKKAFVWPFQKVTKISISPFDFSMQLQAMTIEKLKFSLPAVFTIGPAVSASENDTERLKRYATLLTGESDGRPSAANPKQKTIGQKVVGTGRNHVQDIVKGIIEGETRSLVSTMTMEEVFRHRSVFKQKVIEGVQAELDQFGLRIYNANVKELEDSEGSEYFAFLGRKAHEAASSQARIDVAEAQSRGNIGQAERESHAKQEIAKINATTAVLETERKGEKAQADAKLVDKEIRIEKELELGRIAARRAAESRDAELQREVELKRADMELERRRAIDVVNAKVVRESAREKAEADLYAQQKKSDAVKYKEQADADAALIRATKETEAAFTRESRDTDAAAYKQAALAEAQLASSRKEAEAAFARQARETDAARYRQTALAEAQLAASNAQAQGRLEASRKDAEALVESAAKEAEARLETARKEAEATRLLKEAEAQGVEALARAYGAMAVALGGGPQGVMQWLMLREGLHEKLALANAQAVNGMQPRISVWTTGREGGEDSGAGAAGPVRDVLKMLPPLLETVGEQTGMRLPGWMVQMPEDRGESGKEVKGTGKGREMEVQVNGEVEERL